MYKVTWYTVSYVDTGLTRIALLTSCKKINQCCQTFYVFVCKFSLVFVLASKQERKGSLFSCFESSYIQILYLLTIYVYGLFIKSVNVSK